MTTERARCRVTVKEGQPGHVFLMLESDFLKPIGRNGFISLDLKRGTSISVAHDVASMLNKHIESVAMTFDVNEINPKR